jgi:hypothetical protein
MTASGTAQIDSIQEGPITDRKKTDTQKDIENKGNRESSGQSDIRLESEKIDYETERDLKGLRSERNDGENGVEIEGEKDDKESVNERVNENVGSVDILDSKSASRASSCKELVNPSSSSSSSLSSDMFDGLSLSASGKEVKHDHSITNESALTDQLAAAGIKVCLNGPLKDQMNEQISPNPNSNPKESIHGQLVTKPATEIVESDSANPPTNSLTNPLIDSSIIEDSHPSPLTSITLKENTRIGSTSGRDYIDDPIDDCHTDRTRTYGIEVNQDIKVISTKCMNNSCNSEDLSTKKEDVSTEKENVSTTAENGSTEREDVSTRTESISTISEDVRTKSNSALIGVTSANPIVSNSNAKCVSKDFKEKVKELSVRQMEIAREGSSMRHELQSTQIWLEEAKGQSVAMEEEQLRLAVEEEFDQADALTTSIETIQLEIHNQKNKCDDLENRMLEGELSLKANQQSQVKTVTSTVLLLNQILKEEEIKHKNKVSLQLESEVSEELRLRTKKERIALDESYIQEEENTLSEQTLEVESSIRGEAGDTVEVRIMVRVRVRVRVIDFICLTKRPCL